MVAFLARETRAASPLMPLRIFRSRPVAAANAIQILSVAGMFGMFFLGALYLRRVLGYDALEIGLAFLPVTIAMGTLSIRYSERIFMALGARRALLAGLTLVLAGLVVFALAPVHADYAGSFGVTVGRGQSDGEQLVGTGVSDVVAAPVGKCLGSRGCGLAGGWAV